MDPSILVFVLVLGACTIVSYYAFKKLSSRPYKFKRPPIKIYFKAGLGTSQPGKELCVINSKKLFPSLVSAILIVSIIGFLWSMIDSGYREYLFYVVLLSALELYYVNDLVSKVTVCENAIVYKNIYRKKNYYYSDMDCIETFNIVNMFNSGVGFGYQITKDHREVYRFDGSRFKDITDLEDAFTNGHPAVSHIDKMEA